MVDEKENIEAKEVNKDTSKNPPLPEPFEIISKLKALAILFCYSSWADTQIDIKKEELYGVHSILDDVIKDLERLDNKQRL